MTSWMPMKNFHDWNTTDVIPLGEIIVWDSAVREDYKVEYDKDQHSPDNGYMYWRPLLEEPREPLNILDVMAGVLLGRTYRRPAWYDSKRIYPMAYLRHEPKKDYQLSRVDIMAEDWQEVK